MTRLALVAGMLLLANLAGCSTGPSGWTFQRQSMTVPACQEGTSWLAPCVGYSNGKKVSPTIHGVDGPGFHLALIIVDEEGAIRAQEVKAK